MRVCLAQTNILWEEKEKNIKNAESLIKKASYDKADIILFPEMSFTGFSMNTQLTGEDERYTVSRIAALAKDNCIGVGFGWVRRIAEKCGNVYSILDEKGNLVSEYIKIHPFSYSGEDVFFIGGNSIISYSIKGIPSSTFICYDLRFPELFRTISEEIHLIILPACWPARRSEHWKTLLRARAIENQVYILGVNCQGDIGGLYYSGDSCVINPNGDVLNILSDKTGLITCDLEDDVEEYRHTFPVMKDKKSVLELQAKNLF